MWAQFLCSIENINGRLGAVVWGIPMLVLIIGTGIFFTVRTGFFQFTKAGLIFKETILAIFKKKSVLKTKDKKAITQFQAMSTALAATIGTGNIAGVASAITAGGPGAIFWMWISAFFGMMTNYAENVLGIYYRKKNNKGEWSGGAMYYIEEGLRKKRGMKHFSKILAVIFAFFCVTASFGIGNMTQVNSIAAALNGSFGIPFTVTGIVLANAVALILVGGIKRVGRVTEKIVPFMAIAYTIGTLIIIYVNISEIPAVFNAIIKGAFGFDAVSGGVIGILVKKSVTVGFKRGVFSNEAGLGSSVSVHCCSDIKEPVVQGMWSIFEVFVDTIVMCTLTAFVILSSGTVDLSSGLMISDSQGINLVIDAFKTGIGGFAGNFVTAATFLFAFATVLGWSVYGTRAFEYLFGTRSAFLYKIFYVAFIVLGAVMNLDLVWNISDTLNGLMAIPNLIAVIAISDTVIVITNNYIKRRKKRRYTVLEPMISAYPKIQRSQAEAIRSEG